MKHISLVRLNCKIFSLIPVKVSIKTFILLLFSGPKNLLHLLSFKQTLFVLLLLQMLIKQQIQIFRYNTNVKLHSLSYKTFKCSVFGFGSVAEFFLFLVNASCSQVFRAQFLHTHKHLCNPSQDIQDILVTWAEYLKEAAAIFVRAPSYNKTIFFGGRTSPLDKKDSRIRTLPFATRRATFREVQRVHEVLSTVHVYGKLNYILGIITSCLLIVTQPGYNQKYLNAGRDTNMSAIFSPSKKAWKKTVKLTAQINTDQEKGKIKNTLLRSMLCAHSRFELCGCNGMAKYSKTKSVWLFLLLKFGTCFYISRRKSWKIRWGWGWYQAGNGSDDLRDPGPQGVWNLPLQAQEKEEEKKGGRQIAKWG